MDLQLKEVIVTLYRRDDLESFYEDMAASTDNGAQWIPDRPVGLVKKRPISRNTHYMLTETEAYNLKKDPRVWDTAVAERFKIVRQSNFVNNEPYTISNGNFFKNAPGATTLNVNWRQWGHLHCAGDANQRRKSTWGDGTAVEVVQDSITVFNNGKHVDVVIVDDPVSYDSGEWLSPSTGASRFVQYQWFNELNTLVNSIDDDFASEPTGTITYETNANTPQYHGIHVTGTACGQYYGWANEANIYNLAVTDPWPSGQQVGAFLIFDYLRAFHRSKPINPVTGIRNPTITNHSYGGIYDFETALPFGAVSAINYRGTTYNSSNPGPSGWTEAGVQADFGFNTVGERYQPAYASSIAADVEDAIEEGVVIIGAAGNDNLLMDRPGGDDWNNTVTITGIGTIYYNRGAWPNSPDSGAISVGALSDHSEFRRSTYTMFGPGVDVFAPGDDILSAYGNTGFTDSKYGSGNYYYPIQGTSMASPQVCGIIACLATNKRFTQSDAKGALQRLSVTGDMTFDVNGGGLDDNTCQQGSPNKYITISNPRPSDGLLGETTGERTTGQTFPRPTKVFQAGNYLLGTTVLEITKTWSQGTYTWTPDIHMPTTGTSPYPVAILLHGAGGNGSGMIADWQNRLPGHILVAPTGYNNVWNIIDESDAPDVEVISDLIQLLAPFTNVNENKIRILGYSNGAALALRVATEYTGSEVDMVAAFVSQLHTNQRRSGTWYKPSNHENTDSVQPFQGYDTSYTPHTPRFIMQLNGTNDTTVPYGGGTGPGGAQFFDAPNSAFYLGQAQGYVGSFKGSGDTYQAYPGIEIINYPGGNENYRVVFANEATGHNPTTGMKEVVKEWMESDGATLTLTPSGTTYNIDVTASGAVNYVMNGSDQNGTISFVADPAITVTAGDTINFILGSGVGSHPFWIKTSATTGTANGVTTGTLSGNGQTTGTMSWDTTGVTPGTYYYICQFHGLMTNTITVQ